MTDKKQVNELIINKMTFEQYQALVDAGTVSDTELYFVEDPASSSAVVIRDWGE